MPSELDRRMDAGLARLTGAEGPLALATIARDARDLPLIATAGSTALGDGPFTEIFNPVAHRLLARCDAVLRVGGPSAGADDMVETARALGLRVFTDAAQIPDATPPGG